MLPSRAASLAVRSLAARQKTCQLLHAMICTTMALLPAAAAFSAATGGSGAPGEASRWMRSAFFPPTGTFLALHLGESARSREGGRECEIKGGPGGREGEIKSERQRETRREGETRREEERERERSPGPLRE